MPPQQLPWLSLRPPPPQSQAGERGAEQHRQQLCFSRGFLHVFLSLQHPVQAPAHIEDGGRDKRYRRAHTQQNKQQPDPGVMFSAAHSRHGGTAHSSPCSSPITPANALQSTYCHHPSVPGCPCWGSKPRWPIPSARTAPAALRERAGSPQAAQGPILHRGAGWSQLLGDACSPCPLAWSSQGAQGGKGSPPVLCSLAACPRLSPRALCSPTFTRTRSISNQTVLQALSTNQPRQN